MQRYMVKLLITWNWPWKKSIRISANKRNCCCTTKVHNARKVEDIIRDCGFTELRHPPYSLDLAPNNFFLFKHMRKFLKGKIFESDKEVMYAAENYFADLPKSYFFDRITQLKKTLKKSALVLKKLCWKLKFSMNVFFHS